MPSISVIVPCYNEESTIRSLLEAIARQEDSDSELEVVIADGGSTDRTREEISTFQRDHSTPKIRVIDNPMQAIPNGLNLALDEACGEYIVRLDAHSIPKPDYIRRCITALEDHLGDNVGGVWEIMAPENSWIAQSIAAAAAHPFGAGNVRYRVGGTAGEVDTVPFGAYRKALADRLGGYDESLQTNEDYEFNVRIRKSGGRIWLDPKIRSTYFSRGSLGSLAKQYWRYGYWKVRMLQKHPETIRLRQLSALLVFSLLLLTVLSFWSTLARGLLVMEGLVYGAALLIAGIQVMIADRSFSRLVGVPLAIATMHFSWGTAFLWALLTLPFHRQ